MAKYNKHEYRRASHEKFAAASDAHQKQHYAVSHYLAGVAVECMLRAYRWSIDPSWDQSHDIIALMKKSKVLVFLEGDAATRVQGALMEVARRWAIHHRYAPEDKLHTYLRKAKIEHGSKSLKKNSETMIQLVQTILAECEKKCP